MPALTPEEWPAAIREHGAGLVAGVYVGGCVERGDGSRFRHKAHAHTSGTHKGWLCLLSAARLSDDMLIRHELTHILSGEGHTDGFRRVLLSIGGTLNHTGSLKEYHKRERRPVDPRRPHLGLRHHPECPCRKED